MWMFYEFVSRILLQSLRTEIDNHEPRIHLVCNNGQKLIDEGHEDASEFTQLIEDLLARWQQLKDAVENRRNKLLQSEKAQQVRLCYAVY
jgi:spectrin beta